jgi:hypothetical protein
MEAQVKTGIMLVTPQIAMEWLGKMKHNRPLNQKNVDFIVKQMREGKWKINNDAICFDLDGNLLNGQHRLTSVMKYGSGVNMLIAWGLEKEAFNVMDTGRNRKASDILRANGFSNENNYSAIATFVLNWKQGTFFHREGKRTFDNNDILNFVEKNPKIFDIFSKTAPITKKFKAIGNSHISGMYWVFSEINQEDADKFFELYAGGGNPPKSHPVSVLRELLITDMGSMKKYPPKEKLAFLILAWNAFREKRQVKVLRYNSQIESFPKPI